MPKNTIIPAAGGPGPVPPVAEQSIRFDRTRGTDLRGYTPGGDESDTWTVSWWQKITGDLGVTRVIWEARLDVNNFSQFVLDGLNRFIFKAVVAGVTEASFGSQRNIVDVSNWHHCHFTFSRTTSFIQFSINGYGYPSIQQIPSSIIANIPGYVWLSAVEHFIGGDALSADRASIQMAEMHCVGGSTAARTSFGVFNSKGVWERIVYVGAHGARGFHLTFGRTVDLGEDFSGNNNDFTIHTNAAGGGADQFDDWIEKNYCTLDVNDQRTTGTITEGGLVVAGGSAAVTMRPDFGVWYYEFNGVAVVFDTGVSGQFDPLLGAGSYNFGQLPFADVGPMGGELTLNSNNFPATDTDIARDYVAAIEYAGDDVTPKVITDGTGQSTIYDIEYADITHRTDLLWVKGTSPARTWYQAHRLRLGAQIPINTVGAEETVNALGVITDLPDPGPGFEVTAGATDLENFNKFGNEYNALSLHSRNYAQNIPSPVITDNGEEEIASGDTDTSSSDMEFNSESDSAGTEQICGMRYNNVLIPQGATIISAHLQCEADEVRTGVTCDLEIFCEDVDNALTFVDGAANFNISGRPKTSASTLWTNVPGWLALQDRLAAQLTPNFASSVQEVVDRLGWAAGNSLVVLVEHDQASGSFERRTADKQFAAAPADTHEPMLQVTWRTAGVEAESGVSLFDYTGVGKGADVMHGNQATPDLMAIKKASGDNWVVYNSAISSAGAPENGRLQFNNTVAFTVSTDWDNTAPGGTFLRVGATNRINEEAEEYVGFALSNLRGFLKVFRYVGNNSLNGPEVYLGFKPRFLVIKGTQAVGNWVTMYKCTDIIGAQNNQFNLMDSMGFLNTTDNFFQNIGIEAYSQGFKIRDLDAAVNTNAVEYVGWAIAEAAFPIAKATN